MKIIFYTLFLFLFFTSSKNVLAMETGFIFTHNDQRFEVPQETINSWKGEQLIPSSKILTPLPQTFKSSMLNFVGQRQATPFSKTYHYKLKDIYSYIDNFKTQIETPIIEPELQIENEIVTKFIPPQSGIKLEIYKTAFDALKSLEMGRTNLEITSFVKSPKKQLADTNNLGIKELISTGVSSFHGSPNNRRHNIAIGVDKFKGVIIPQGAEFSFNKILGPVEKEQGFLPELVIKKTGTVPEFGGGLCQVSSTTFRAAMEAGLPITQRRNHAYAVQYYSPQGTDATIYPGVVDLKFINDTSGAILVWPYLKDKNTLIFDFYGTKDSRKVTLNKPIQYDKKTDGSMKATWTRVVEKNGESRTDEFKSTYQPPALFHKVEQFVTAAPPPASGLPFPENVTQPQ